MCVYLPFPVKKNLCTVEMIQAFSRINEAPLDSSNSFNFSTCLEWLVWKLALCPQCYSFSHKLMKLIFFLNQEQNNPGHQLEISQVREVSYFDKVAVKIRAQVFQLI